MREYRRYIDAIFMDAKFFRASKDVKIAGYDVPKDTIIMANIYAVHMDADHWERPEEFNHARFLSADGSKFIRDDHMIAFGYGERD